MTILGTNLTISFNVFFFMLIFFFHLNLDSRERESLMVMSTKMEIIRKTMIVKFASFREVVAMDVCVCVCMYACVCERMFCCFA